MAINGIKSVFLKYDTIPWETDFAGAFVLPSGRKDAAAHLNLGASVYTIRDGREVRIDCAYWREILDAVDAGEIRYLALGEAERQMQPEKIAA